MPRYIDADEALIELDKELVSDEFNYAFRAISRVKTADVVKVVRCRDCEYWDPGSPMATVIPTPCRCRLRREDYGMTAEDFCSYGRRKEKTDEC